MPEDKTKEKLNEQHGKQAAVPAPEQPTQLKAVSKGGREREQGEEVTNELPEWWNAPDSDIKEGSVLEGFYRGWKMISPASAEEPFKIYIIESEETGELFSFSGAIANRKMSRVPRDCYVWITYEGKKKTGRRNALTHHFKVVLPKGVLPLPEILDSAAE